MKQKKIGKVMHIFLRLWEKVTLSPTPINAFDKLSKSEATGENCMTSGKNTTDDTKFGQTDHTTRRK